MASVMALNRCDCLRVLYIFSLCEVIVRRLCNSTKF